MNLKTERTAKLLTYAGILPFLFLSIAVSLKDSGQDYRFALQCYGVVIISFLCGIHWATYLFFPDKSRRNLLVISNAITLITCASLFPLLHDTALAIQSIGFCFLLLLDYELLKQRLIPIWYFNMRRNATVTVVLLLGVVSFL